MKLSQRFKNMLSTSLLGRMGKKISAGYRASKIFSFYTAGEVDAVLENSCFIPQKSENKVWNAGILLPKMQRLAFDLLHISVGNVALISLFWCLSAALSNLLDANYNTAMIFGAAVVILLPLCFIRASVYSLVATSFIGRFFEIRGDGTTRQPNKWFMLLIGALAIIGAMYLPMPYSLLLPLIPIALVFLTYLKPLFFITVILICLPIFGTSVCVTLSIILILSHGLGRVSGRIQKQKINYVDILFAIFAVLCLIASTFSFATGDSFRVSLLWVILYMTVFVIYRNIRSLRDVVIALCGLLFGALIASVIGLMQYFSGQISTTWTDTSLFSDLSIRIYSTFANPNVFGEFLLLVAPISAGLGIYFDKWKYKLTCWVLSIVTLITLALTYSRGCYAGIAVTAVVFLWMYNKKILGILLVIGTPIGITMLPQNMIDRILSMVNFSDSSTSYRLQIYEGTFNMLKEYWASGVGIGEKAFNFVYPYFGLRGIVAPHSHSLFLQLVVSFGIAGLIYMLVLLFVYHRNIISLMAKLSVKDKRKSLLIVFGAVLSGFIIQSFFDYTWYNYRVYMLFWIILAFGFTIYKIIRNEDKPHV